MGIRRLAEFTIDRLCPPVSDGAADPTASSVDVALPQPRWEWLIAINARATDAQRG